MKKQLTFALASALTVSTVLAGCGNDEKKASDAKAKEGGPSGEQVLNLLEASEIPTMDTVLATDAVSFNVMTNTMEGLYVLGKDDKPMPGAAESYAASEDGKKYTFKLRKDAKWSNGDPVTAKDFVYAWKRAVDKATAAEYAYIMFDVKNAEKINKGELPADQLGIKAVDDYTLEVELERPVPYFISLISFSTFYPQDEKFVKAQGDKFGLEASTTVYNGPFVLSEWKHEQSFQLKKNDSYWDQTNVKLSTINFNIVKDVATGVNLFETKEVDRAGLTAEFVDKYKSTPEFVTKQDPSVFFVRMNEKNKALANKNIRKAIMTGFDKEGIANVLLNNGSIAAGGLVPKDFVSGPDKKDFRAENGDLAKTNVKKAKELFEAGKKELGVDTIQLELLNFDSESAKKIGEYLKEQLEKNLPGLTITIKQQPFAQKLKLETNGQYDLSFAGWGPDYPDPMTFVDMFVTNGAHNQMGYSNAKYDELIQKGKTDMTDLKARWNNLLEAENILFEDAAIAPVYQRGRAFLQKEYVKGIVEHNFGGDFSFKWAYVQK
ncbi:peptide ABC transporter substrate-binding protein [Ectobacillus ponti]|uniref:Periplasmic oligopeptide-binding protein OppA n=1 Tax=Ectobacillus ponti TaxID=2961894 RepID=A0AA42BQC2_9BACI|nr:peptide ABC transporter substrate-binding protein [Ectobacillus ponti]MCP8968304.1 peptide ABC transporter substrate-binding protein [Ectobacillus ponti]